MRSDRDILIVCIFTFITVVTWIFVDFVKTTQSSTVTSVTEELLAPLPGPIDQKLLRDLEARQAFE